METYDWKKKPSEKKMEEREKKEFSDRVVKEGDSYRRLTKREVKDYQKAKKKNKEPEPEPVVDTTLDDLLEFVGDAVGGLLNLTMKIFPLVILFMILSGTGIISELGKSLDAMLGQSFPTLFDGGLYSRVIIFVMFAMPFWLVFGNRRHRRWFL